MPEKLQAILNFRGGSRISEAKIVIHEVLVFVISIEGYGCGAECSTPFGEPVDTEVKIITHTASGGFTAGRPRILYVESTANLFTAHDLRKGGAGSFCLSVFWR
ncbi:MAG: hypothetical protein IJU26_09195 [Synergistaceae bacterium]|nr:hypothetical protein [Synergistaceae bacterium]